MMNDMIISIFINDASPVQFYIVAGGYDTSHLYLASTEILKKNGGTSWVAVASLPAKRSYIRGVSLPDGHFLVSGEGYVVCYTK